MLTPQCSHLNEFRIVRPSADGCEECLATNGRWVHPVMESYDPREGWGWCYVDEVMIDLADNVTAHPAGWRY